MAGAGTAPLFMGGNLVSIIPTKSTCAGNQLRYLHMDGLGSVVAVTDPAGAALEFDSYDAWGKRRYPNGSADPTGALGNGQTNRGYTGQEFLEDSGFVHLNGRLYDPSVGRMISTDPVTARPYSTQGWNRYAYVENNSLRRTDPTGNCEEEVYGPPAPPPPAPSAPAGDTVTTSTTTDIVAPSLAADQPSPPTITQQYNGYTITNLPSGQSFAVINGIDGNYVMTLSSALSGGFLSPSDLFAPANSTTFTFNDGSTFGFSVPGGGQASTNNDFATALLGAVNPDTGLTGAQSAQFVNTLGNISDLLVAVTGPAGGEFAALGNELHTIAAGMEEAAAGAEDASAAIRGGNDLSGRFNPYTNSSGGTVYLSDGEISQNNFRNTALYAADTGEVNIISGVHGYPDGSYKLDFSMYDFDAQTFGAIPNIKVYNFPDLSPNELQSLLNTPGTTIGGFCNSCAVLTSKN